MALTLEENIALRQRLRRDVTDYGPPGIRMHPPVALRDTRMPSGAIVRPESLAARAITLPPHHRVRLWPFWMLGNYPYGIANHVIRSPAFRGPLMVTTLTVATPATAAGTSGLALSWSPEPLPERATELVDFSTVGTLIHEIGDAVEHTGPISPWPYLTRKQGTDQVGSYHDHHLNAYIAHEGTVYLYLQMYYNGTYWWDGWLRVVEEVDPDDLCLMPRVIGQSPIHNCVRLCWLRRRRRRRRALRPIWMLEEEYRAGQATAVYLMRREEEEAARILGKDIGVSECAFGMAIARMLQIVLDHDSQDWEPETTAAALALTEAGTWDAFVGAAQNAIADLICTDCTTINWADPGSERYRVSLGMARAVSDLVLFEPLHLALLTWAQNKCPPITVQDWPLPGPEPGPAYPGMPSPLKCEPFGWLTRCTCPGMEPFLAEFPPVWPRPC